MIKTGRRNQRTNNVGCGGCFNIIFGFIVIIAAFYFVRDILTFLPGTVATQGTVISCTTVYDSDGSERCSPTTRFVTQSGQPVTINVSESITVASDFRVGERVPVRYHAKTPQDGRVISLPPFWGWLLLLGIFVPPGLFALFRIIIRRLKGSTVSVKGSTAYTGSYEQERPGV